VHLLEHLLEGGATDELYLLTLKIQVGGNVVERPNQSLYRNSLHISSLFLYFIVVVIVSLVDIAVLKKTPLSLFCEAEPYLVFSILLFFILTYGLPLHRFLQSKNKSRKSKHSTCSLSRRFC